MLMLWHYQPITFRSIPEERDASSPSLSTGDWWLLLSNQKPCFTAKLLTPNSSTLVSTSLVSACFTSTGKHTFLRPKNALGRRGYKSDNGSFWQETGSLCVFSPKNQLDELAVANVDVSWILLCLSASCWLWFFITSDVQKCFSSVCKTRTFAD